MYFGFAIGLALPQANAKGPNRCVDLFSKPAIDRIYFSANGKWMLSSSVTALGQNWRLVDLETSHRLYFKTELPLAWDRISERPIFSQTVSFESDNLKIYAYTEGHFRSFYQFNYLGEQIGSPSIRRSTGLTPDITITNSFFIADDLRFYKHGQNLFVQNSSGTPLGRIAAPTNLSSRTIIKNGEHLVTLTEGSLHLYRIQSDGLTSLKVLELSDVLSFVKSNSSFSKLIKNQNWNFDAKISVTENDTLLFSISSNDGRQHIALVSLNNWLENSLENSSHLQFLGTQNPRFINKTFGTLERTGEFFTMEHYIQTRRHKQQYTSVLRFYTSENFLKKNIELDGYWQMLWSSSHTVVVGNNGKGLMQAWDAEGTLTGVHTTPRAGSHVSIQDTTVQDLGHNSWLVADSRVLHQYRIFDSELRLRARIQGQLLPAENGTPFGLFSVIPVQRISTEHVPVFSGLAVYNRAGQQVAYFPQTSDNLRKIRFTSSHSLVMQNKNNSDWMQINWDEI